MSNTTASTVQIKEKVIPTMPGISILIGGLAVIVFLVLLMIVTQTPYVAVPGVFLIMVTFFVLAGLKSIAPNEARVLQLFGEYVGTAKTEGLRWVNPFYTSARVSLRVRNFESSKLKVNDQHGSPIEIAAVVVWKVVDSAEASFEVDDYEDYVNVQSEAAVRNLATRYPYDSHADEMLASATSAPSAELSLRGNTAEIAKELQNEIRDRVGKAGVEIIEARISHLAYAPEIAGAMLRRQQAGAVLAARKLIVQGAVGMVSSALDQLQKENIVELDAERKAAMVSNLLVVLCGEQQAQPVVNTGTLYQ
jgi:regulator of protease activity HflC (stomatin/prohibitin superfamily)